MEKYKPLVKHLQLRGGKTAAKLGQSFGSAFDAAMEFLRERRIVAWEIVAERIVFVRGRGKRLTRVSKTVRDRLVVTMPKPHDIIFDVSKLPRPGKGNALPLFPIPDRRASGRQRGKIMPKPGVLQLVYDCLFDTVFLPENIGANLTYLFVIPIGNYAGRRLKQPSDTNMVCSGMLPAPEKFLIRSFRSRGIPDPPAIQ